MQVNIKASYRDTATVKVHTLDDFIRKVTFSPKGIQPDELQRRKNNGAVRLGHGIERFFYSTIAAKIGCEYIVRQLIPDWQPGVAIGNGFVFPDDDSDSDEQPAVESKTSSYDSELTEEEKKTLGDLARQQDKLELVWAIKGFDFGYLNHLKINQTRHYTDKKTGKQVPVKMPWEVMKEQGAKFIGFFWNPMTDMSQRHFFCGFLPIPANSCYFLLTPAERPQTPPGTSGSHPASSFMAFNRVKAISGAIMFWQEFQES